MKGFKKCKVAVKIWGLDGNEICSRKGRDIGNTPKKHFFYKTNHQAIARLGDWIKTDSKFQQSK